MICKSVDQLEHDLLRYGPEIYAILFLFKEKRPWTYGKVIQAMQTFRQLQPATRLDIEGFGQLLKHLLLNEVYENSSPWLEQTPGEDDLP